MDREGVVQWLVGDHLGTTSLVLKADGTVHSEARHYPYGEERWSSGTLPTDYRFTGQRQDSGLGLIHMGARQYDPTLGRWISADTIVPEPGSSQSYNRYAYVRNSPLNYVDPTGHWEEEWEEQFEEEHGRPPTEQDWWDYQFSLQILDWSADAWITTYTMRLMLYAANITVRSGVDMRGGVFGQLISVQWRLEEVMAVGRAVSNIAQVFGNDARHVTGGATIVRMHNARFPLVIMGGKCGAFEAFGTIFMNDSAFRTMDAAEHTLTHELGHYLAESQHLLGDFKRARSQEFPNEYAEKNGASEDFAASFEIFVYQSIGRPVVEAGKQLTVDQSRWGFFAQFVH